MVSPIASQTTSRIQVSEPRDAIIAKHTRTPRIGTTGTNGVRYGRGALGLVLRIQIMPMHTMTNASSVPMLVMCPSLEIGRKPENSETKTMKIMLQRHGVWNLGWMSENTAGNRPSFDMEKNTRDWPSSMTRMTDVYPAMMPITMVVCSATDGKRWITVATVVAYQAKLVKFTGSLRGRAKTVV